MQELQPIISKLNVDEENRAAESFRFMEEQRIKKAHAPQIWNDLKEKLTKACEEIPIELRVDSGINKLKIKNLGNGRLLVLSFDPMVPCILCDGLRGQQRVILMFEVNAKGTIVSLVDQGVPN